jgi:hypothetical protein
MKKLNQVLIKQLIEIGRSETIPSSHEKNIFLSESQGKRSPSIKLENCDNFSTENLRSLYKGLVLCEKEFKWLDGSLTKTALILQMIQERLDSESNYQEIKGLFEFGFANRGHNPYVPTGTKIHSACVTFEDYLSLNHIKSINITKHDARMLREQKESRRMKAIKNEFKERAKEKRMKERVERKIEIDKYVTIIQKNDPN